MDYVTSKALAERFGMERGNAHKWLKAAAVELGLRPLRVRPLEARGQLMTAWAGADAARLVEHRRARGFAVDGEEPRPVLEPDRAA